MPAPAFRSPVPWVLASLALTVAALVGQVPLWILTVFGACAIWRQALERPNPRLPSLPVRVLIFAPVGLGVLLTYGMHPGAAGMLAFLVALLSLKVLEMRSARDLTVVAVLGYFMILSAFFYSQSLALSVYLSVAVLTNTVALIRCHGGGGERGGWSAVRLALLLSAQAMPLVFLFFIVFPRVQGNFLRRLGGVSTGLTGMSEHLEPGSFSTLVQSDEPAFWAAIDAGVPLPSRSLYWRGLVLDICERGLSWRASESSALARAPKAAAPGGARVRQTITLWPHGAHWLFALERPVEAIPTPAVRARLMSTGVLYSPDAVLNKAMYSVVSQLGAMAPPDPETERLDFCRMPPADLNPRAKALAEGWRQRGKSPDEILRLANAFFRDGGFTYTLSPGALPPKTALDTFLFKTRRGFCEHYAAAYCTLLRAAGLPARIVVGYQGGEFNSWGDFYMVRQSDAHAWAEVWLDGRGWEREDPTALVAPERLSFGAESYRELASEGPLTDAARLERLSQLSEHGGLRWMIHNVFLAWDSVDQQWNLRVLGYDGEKQAAVFENLGLGRFDSLVGTALTVTTIAVVLGLGALGLYALGQAPPGPRGDGAQRLYLRFCRKLDAAAGVERTPAEGPLAYAERATGALPQQAAQIARITQLYVEARYSPGDAGGLDDLREAVRTFQPAAARKE